MQPTRTTARPTPRALRSRSQPRSARTARSRPAAYRAARARAAVRAGRPPRRTAAARATGRCTDPTRATPERVVAEAPAHDHERVRPEAEEAAHRAAANALRDTRRGKRRRGITGRPTALEPERMREQIATDRDRALAGEQRCEEQERRQHAAAALLVAARAVMAQERERAEECAQHRVAVRDPADGKPVRLIEGVEQRGQPRLGGRAEHAAVERRRDDDQCEVPIRLCACCNSAESGKKRASIA